MSTEEKENWVKIKEALEEADKTDCYFYKRAAAIVAGEVDPMESRWD